MYSKFISKKEIKFKMMMQSINIFIFNTIGVSND